MFENVQILTIFVNKKTNVVPSVGLIVDRNILKFNFQFQYIIIQELKFDLFTCTEMPTVPFLPYLLRFFIDNMALRFFLIKYVFLKFRLYIIVCEGECTKSLQKHVHQLLVSRMCVCAVR